MSLRARLNLLVTALTLVFLAAGVTLMLREMRGQIREEIEASNRITAQLMTAVLYSTQLFARGPMQQQAVQDFLQRLGRVRANDIRLLDRLGQPVWVSPPSQYKAGRHAPAWFAQLVGPHIEPVRLEADSFALLITPDASRSVLDAWDDLFSLALLAAGFFVLVNATVFFVVGRAVKPTEITAQELAENRQLTHLIQSHLEDERRVLARELHDEIGQYLTAIKTLGQALANRAEGAGDAPTQEASRAIVSSAGQIYDAMHRIIRRLRPMALEHMGLADTLREAVNEWRTLHPQLRFELQLADALPRLGDDTEIALFRIAQEAVTNAARHAQAASVKVGVTVQDGSAVLSVSDDGRGTDATRLHDSGRYGLIGMRERAQGLGGSLTITTPSEGGTCIVARVPIKAGVAA